MVRPPTACSRNRGISHTAGALLGFQRLRDRFKLEKYVALGMVRATFHFFVREELQPQPEASDEFQAPDRGNWLLERISIGIRVA